MDKLTAGVGKELGLHSNTVSAIARQFVQSRDFIGQCPRWRSRRRGSLGWVPFKTSEDFRLFPEKGAIRVLGRLYRLWYSRHLPDDAKIKTASFSEDARGRWYFNIQIDVAQSEAKVGRSVGIDLGLKDFATLSDGRKIIAPQFYRQHEKRLMLANKHNQKRRVRTLHAKVSNCRRHFLHESSTRIVREYACVIVGDVNAESLAKTRMAKSVLDAGWSAFRLMLQYKCLQAGASFEIVDEKWTTQTCSDCGSIGGPKGIAGLRMRQWTCEHCGSSHDRDVNAARNLLVGAERRPPVAGILAA